MTCANIESMRASKAAQPAIWALAFLVFVGMNGQAFAALFCSTERCGKMLATLPVEQSDQGAQNCCGKGTSTGGAPERKKKTAPPASTCCCKISSVQDATLSENPALPGGGVDIPCPMIESFAWVLPQVAPLGAPIHFGSDSSPPPESRSPWRGRAPPST